MSRHRHLNLDALPWPVNVLKFNQVLHELEPGDDMTAFVSDGDVAANLKQLLSGQADLLCDVTQEPPDYRIRVTRQ